ncbi:hypothetical protein A2U01_0096798, partial [Trifolium medium]|nr:hypothetical protein [Trifolium medium]
NCMLNLSMARRTGACGTRRRALQVWL